MVLIEIKKEDKEKVFEILMNNGLFRALSENRFDIVENSDEVLEEFKKNGIEVKVIKEEDWFTMKLYRLFLPKRFNNGKLIPTNKILKI